MKLFLIPLGVLSLFLANSTRSALFASASADGGRSAPFVVALAGAAAAAASDAWIGVRVAPAPEPLAAHLDRAGLMIANVVSESPADRAGLERYDVLVSVDEREIRNLEDLTAAIVEAGASRDIEMVVLRGGRQQTLRVRPEPRPQTDSYEFKFEEPAADATDSFERYFGHRLTRDALGNWMLEPLGRLNELPEDVQNRLHDIGGPAWEQWLDQWKDFNAEPFRLHLFNDPDDAARWFFKFDDFAAEDEHLEFRIRTRTDAGELLIERSEDGRITVERTDPAGEKSAATYDNVEDLAREDADAHRLLRRHSLAPGRPMILTPPNVPDLPALQQDFQKRIQEQLERARQLQKRAADQARDAMSGAKSAWSQSWSSSQWGLGGDSEESRSISVDENGVTIKITRDGKSEEFHFDSIDGLRQARPDLYDEFKPWLDGSPAGSWLEDGAMMAVATA